MKIHILKKYVNTRSSYVNRSCYCELSSYKCISRYFNFLKFQRARRACVQQFQGINIYKEEESETTCTLESDDETSEDDDDDADESSIQEDADNEKGKNKEKDTHIKTNNNQPSCQPENKGKI